MVRTTRSNVAALAATAALLLATASIAAPPAEVTAPHPASDDPTVDLVRDDPTPPSPGPAAPDKSATPLSDDASSAVHPSALLHHLLDSFESAFLPTSSSSTPSLSSWLRSLDVSLASAAPSRDHSSGALSPATVDVEITGRRSVEVRLPPLGEGSDTYAVAGRHVQANVTDGVLRVDVDERGSDGEQARTQFVVRMPVDVQQEVEVREEGLGDGRVVLGMRLRKRLGRRAGGDGGAEPVEVGARFKVEPVMVSRAFHSDHDPEEELPLPAARTAHGVDVGPGQVEEPRGAPLLDLGDKAEPESEKPFVERYPWLSAAGNALLSVFQVVKMVAGIFIISAALFILSFELALYKTRKDSKARS